MIFLTVWKRNLAVCWMGSFTTSIGMSLVVPFLAFYIENLGVTNIKSVEQLSGIAFAITFLVASIMSPMWGKLSDKKGRKLVMMCTAIGLSLVSFGTAFAANVYMLIFFRILQGLISGFIPSAMSFVAKETPEGHTGWALATLTTGSMAGTLLGPIFGGYLDELVGIRIVFFITAGFLFMSFLVVKLFLVENKGEFNLKNQDSNGKKYKEKSIWDRVESRSFIIILLITTCIINTSNQSIEPIVSLYVRQLLNAAHIGSSHISLYSGVVMSATGFGILISASKIGRLGDKGSYFKVLSISIIISAVVFIPMAFVRNPWELMILRFVLGICQAGVMPSIATMLKKTSAKEISGTIFGYNQAAQFSGLVIGPLIGSQISANFGFTHVFFFTAFLLMLNYILIIHTKKSNRERIERLSL